MTSKKIIVAGDGHFHLYPCYEPARAIGNLIQNLDLMAVSAGGIGREKDVFKIAFLAESRQHDYFRKILDNEINFRAGGFEVSDGPEDDCVSFSKDGENKLCLVAGRQIVTGEKLEILGLAMKEIIPDGLSAVEAIERIIAAGGLPVLAFSPGKWLFKRGKIALKLAEYYGNTLIIGDSALRPLGWGPPAIMRRAGAKILPGSDPLPLPGDDKCAGRYGFVCQVSFDLARPLASMKEIIANSPAAIMPAGKRYSLPAVAAKLSRLLRN